VLIDECLPKKLAKEITGFEVITVPEAGWAGKQNGELLKLASKDFDIFITIDQNLTAQQAISKTGLSVMVISAKSNRFNDLQPLIPKIIESINSIKPNSIVKIKA